MFGFPLGLLWLCRLWCFLTSSTWTFQLFWQVLNALICHVSFRVLLVLSLNSGAYISERTCRHQSILKPGEAAYSLSITSMSLYVMWSCLKLLKISCPILGNEFVTIIKDSSLLQTIGVMELWKGAQTVATTTSLTLTPLLFAAFYYWCDNSYDGTLETMEQRLGEGRK